MSTALEVTGNTLTGLLGLVLGTNLFLGFMPTGPDGCTALYEYDGLPPVETMGLTSPRIDKPRVQVVCRGAVDDYLTPRDLAMSIRSALAALGETSFAGLTVMRWAPQGTIMPMGLDGEQRDKVAVNFQVWLR